MKQWTPLLAVGVVLAIVAASKTSKAGTPQDPPPETEGDGTDEEVIEPDPPPADDGWIQPGEGNPVYALAAGPASDPEIAALLTELGAYLEGRGVDMTLTSPEELTRMNTGAHAIPPRALWPNIVPTLILWQETVRRPLGFPMKLGGYRPYDYNKAVGGARRSQHQWFAALDIRPVGDHNTAANRRKLGLVGARVYLESPADLRVGFGAYGAPTPGNIHLDTGFDHRTWREADHYVDLVADS